MRRQARPARVVVLAAGFVVAASGVDAQPARAPTPDLPCDAVARLGRDLTEAEESVASRACVEALATAAPAERDRLLGHLLRDEARLTSPDYRRVVDRLGARAPLRLRAYPTRWFWRPEYDLAAGDYGALQREARAAGDALATAYLATMAASFALTTGRADGERWARRARALTAEVGAPRLQALAVGFLASPRLDAGDYVAALALYREALDLQEATGNVFNAAATRINIGLIFEDFGDYDTAIDQYRTAIATVERLSPGGHFSLVGGYSQLGTALARQGEHADAIGAFERSLAWAERTDWMPHSGLTTFEMARSRDALGERDRALALAEASLPLFQADDAAAKGPVWTWLAARYLERGRTADALAALGRARGVMETDGEGPSALLRTEGLDHWVQEYARGMADVLRRLDRPAEALAYADVALTLSDRQYQADQVEAVADMGVLLELRDREAEVGRMAELAELAEARASRQRAWIVGGAAALALLAALVVALLRAARLRRRAAALLAATSDEVDRRRAEAEAALERTERLLAERDVLLREVHHRVKNNLQLVASLLNLQASTVRDAAAQAALQQMRSRIEALALVHRRLYGDEDLRTVDAATYLAELGALLKDAFSRTGTIRLDVAAAPIHLDADTAVPLGLAATELVSNAYKHAFHSRPGRIRLTLNAAGGRYRLCVEDDGPGLPPGLVAPPPDTLGLQLAADLAVQLGGTFEVGRSDRLGGACVAIAFPAPRPPCQHTAQADAAPRDATPPNATPPDLADVPPRSYGALGALQ